jgi:hypothetical protein
MSIPAVTIAAIAASADCVASLYADLAASWAASLSCASVILV